MSAKLANLASKVVFSELYLVVHQMLFSSTSASAAQCYVDDFTREINKESTVIGRICRRLDIENFQRRSEARRLALQLLRGPGMLSHREVENSVLHQARCKMHARKYFWREIERQNNGGGGLLNTAAGV